MKPIKFINPDGSNREEVKSFFKKSISLLIDFLASANQNKVIPKNPDWESIDLTLPEKPFSEVKIQKELQTILKLSMNPANTSYIGHMDSLPTAHSIIGSLYSSALNNNMFSLEMSPYFTRIEYAIIKQFSNLFGLPSSSSGIIVSGGSLSNIQAIITARNYHLKSNTGDISTSEKPLVFFASEHSHISIKKAAMISGLGVKSLIYVNSDDNGKMDINDLNLKIISAIEKGLKPFAVIATLGTTVTGNIDPINKIALICKSHNLWLHADAIYGGAIILSKKEKHRLKGIDQADSISFNPQKWMHIAKTCSLLLFRDSKILNQFFSMKAHYTKEQNEFVNLSEISIQGTKQADVLKLWLSILSIGMSGYEEMIDNAYKRTNVFIKELEALPNIEFASKQEMNIPTFRLLGDNEKENDRLNSAFNEYAIREHNLFFSLPTHNGKLWQRTILLNPFIDNSIILKVCNAIKLFKE
jgi:glutamate/tyrosine decarboxylase-like PLP-dependent enzyme